MNQLSQPEFERRGAFAWLECYLNGRLPFEEEKWTIVFPWIKAIRLRHFDEDGDIQTKIWKFTDGIPLKDFLEKHPLEGIRSNPDIDGSTIWFHDGSWADLEPCTEICDKWYWNFRRCPDIPE